MTRGIDIVGYKSQSFQSNDAAFKFSIVCIHLSFLTTSEVVFLKNQIEVEVCAYNGVLLLVFVFTVCSCVFLLLL